MQKSRVSNSRRKTGRKNLKTKTAKPQASKSRSRSPRKSASPAGEVLHRFVGVSLSGGKSDKACVAVVEYFPEHKKIFLARLYEKIKTEEFISADIKIYEIIAQFQDQIDFVAFDAPLTLPVCLKCPCKSTGYETCPLPHNEWMRNFYAEVNKGKKPKKMFTPYTQRCAEAYISHGLEESFEIHHAMGSNMAPLTARAQFIQRRLNVEAIEIFPKLSVWRLGQEMKVAKSHLKFHKHAIGGDESRSVFLNHLADRKGVFIYQQDMKSMVENNHAFEAFICAYTAYLKFMKQTQPRPEGFPKDEAWIEFPKD